eukprot:gene960-1113_t
MNQSVKVSQLLQDSSSSAPAPVPVPYSHGVRFYPAHLVVFLLNHLAARMSLPQGQPDDLALEPVMTNFG